MELIIEVLNGDRKGMHIPLPISTAKGVVPYVLENEALIFRLKVAVPCDAVDLLLGEVSLSFSPDQSKGQDDFILYPEYKNGSYRGYECMFHNYFGFVSLALRFWKGLEETVIELAPFEVLASKISAMQTERMLEYLFEESSIDLIKGLGVATRSAQLNYGGNEPQHLIEQLIKDISLLEDLSPYLLNNPLKTLTSRLELIAGSQVESIDEQGIAWLMENMSVLDETDDAETSHLEYDNLHYQASEIQTSVMRETTDIYENQVIHGYINHLLSFTVEIIDGYATTELKTSANSHNGYVSFFETKNELLRDIRGHHAVQIELCRKRLLSLKDAYTRYLPVSKSSIQMPRITPKIKANRSYLALFRTMIKWYQNSSINWEKEHLLLAINDVPKLFEYYTLLRFIRWCDNNGKRDAQTLDAAWTGSVGVNRVVLRYEPTYWMAGHTMHSGAFVNTQNRSVSQSRSDYLGKKRSHKWQHRKPDLIIELTQPDKPLQLLVFDAKYTNRDKAYEVELTNLTMKYVHGIAHKTRGSVVNAMIILYPDSDDQYMDYHTAPHDAFGTVPQYPILGIQAFSIQHSNSKDVGIDKLLSHLVNTHNL